MVDLNLNWWAVLFATALAMVIGMLWYSPVLFGKYWQKLIGKKMKDMGDPTASYVATTATALLQTFVLGLLVYGLNATTASDGAAFGLLLWVGIAATTSLSDYVFAGRPLVLWAINQGYYLVLLMANGAILAVWR
ncbi:MAG TPA: DUF1761 domain-containing protein [Candidatus Saccharimonadales bacterium]|nr:DUF1761 domain-containing protein [Candidatus Saccharimonadales bacterium]